VGIARPARAVGLVVLAAGCGIAGSFVHRWASPLGVVLTIGAAAGVFLFARRWSRSRVGIGAVSAAWLLPVLLLAQRRPEGDLVIAGDVVGMVFLFGGAACAAVALGMGTSTSASREFT
jgi:hypothetical protein